jgi:hypothetical protein
MREERLWLFVCPLRFRVTASSGQRLNVRIMPVMGGCLRVCGMWLGRGLNSFLGFLVVKDCE